MKFSLPLSLLAIALATTACEKKPTGETTLARPVAATQTFETERLGRAVDAYEAAPTPDNLASANKALAELDGEIAELDARVAKTAGGEKDEAALKRSNLSKYRETQSARLAAFKVKAAVSTPAMERTTEVRDKVEDKIQEGREKTGNALERLGEKIRN